MEMKCGYKMILHNQHKKDENILYIIKRLFGELITIHRLVKLVIMRMFSTQFYYVIAYRCTQTQYYSNLPMEKLILRRSLL